MGSTLQVQTVVPGHALALFAAPVRALLAGKVNAPRSFFAGLLIGVMSLLPMIVAQRATAQGPLPPETPPEAVAWHAMMQGVGVDLGLNVLEMGGWLELDRAVIEGQCGVATTGDCQVKIGVEAIMVQRVRHSDEYLRSVDATPTWAMMRLVNSELTSHPLVLVTGVMVEWEDAGLRKARFMPISRVGEVDAAMILTPRSIIRSTPDSIMAGSPDGLRKPGTWCNGFPMGSTQKCICDAQRKYEECVDRARYTLAAAVAGALIALAAAIIRCAVGCSVPLLGCLMASACVVIAIAAFAVLNIAFQIAFQLAMVNCASALTEAFANCGILICIPFWNC